MGITELERKVRWHERDGTTWFQGKVIDEVSIKEEFEWGDYLKMIQLIESDKGGKIIRFAYYVKPHGSPYSKYVYGSQNTLVVTQENAHTLFRKAKEKGFF